MVDVETAEGYDRWAASYESDGNPMLAFDEAAFRAEFAPPVAGKRLLDLGCGTGRHAVRFAREGALVTAVDFSAGMMEQAKQKPGAEQITFVQHDLTKPLPLANQSFDLAVSALVLEHLADLPLFFGEIARVCIGGAPVFVTAMHPAMMLKQTQAGFHDHATGEKVRPHGYANQIADFVNAILGAGLRLEHMKEYVCDEDLAARWPRAAGSVGWPVLVTFRASCLP